MYFSIDRSPVFPSRLVLPLRPALPPARDETRDSVDLVHAPSVFFSVSGPLSGHHPRTTLTYSLCPRRAAFISRVSSWRKLSSSRLSRFLAGGSF